LGILINSLPLAEDRQALTGRNYASDRHIAVGHLSPDLALKFRALEFGPLSKPQVECHPSRNTHQLSLEGAVFDLMRIFNYFACRLPEPPVDAAVDEPEFEKEQQ